jgi:hypothetical protein
MSFNMENLSNSSDVVTSSDVGKMSGLVLDPFDNSVLFEIVFNGISLVDFRVRESNGSAVVGNNVWDLVGSNSLGLDLQQFDFSFGVFNFEEVESTFNIIEKSVVFVSLDNSDGVHNTDWELDGSSDFIINFDASFSVLDDNVGFSAGEAESEVISK